MEVIGYEKERAYIERLIDSGEKYVIITGDRGIGKSTVLWSLAEKRGGILVDVSCPDTFKRVINKKLNPILSLFGLNREPFELLKQTKKPVLVCLDEGRDIEELLLHLKSAVTSNEKLQLVFAFPPTQLMQITTDYPEVSTRFSPTVTLRGLGQPEMETLLAKKTKLSKEQVKEIVGKTNNPNYALSLAHKLERNENPDEETYVVPEDAKATPTERRILEVLKQKPGMKPKEIAEKSGIGLNSTYTHLVRLQKPERRLVVAQNGLYYSYGAPKEGDIGG